MNTPVTCATGCNTNSISGADFSLCNPKYAEGEFQRSFLTNLDEFANFGAFDESDPLDDAAVNSAVAWSNRMDQTGAADGAIVTWHIIGEKVAPEVTRSTSSLDRERVANRKHVVAWECDEYSDLINDMFRKISECGLTAGLWLETRGKILFSSTEGHHIPITAQVFCERIVEKGKEGRIIWQGTFEWDELGTETTMDSVAPATPEPGS